MNILDKENYFCRIDHITYRIMDIIDISKSLKITSMISLKVNSLLNNLLVCSQNQYLLVVPLKSKLFSVLGFRDTLEIRAADVSRRVLGDFTRITAVEEVIPQEKKDVEQLSNKAITYREEEYKVIHIKCVGYHFSLDDTTKHKIIKKIWLR